VPKVRIDDTLEMYYEDHDFADPWREHETVVLHAGNLKDHRLWYAWVPLLAQEYRTITLDARGHGLSTVPAPGHDWSIKEFARDLRGLLDALKIKRAHLIGETTGGPVTLQFAHDYPDRTLSVTQCSAYFKHNDASPTPHDHEHISKLGLTAWVQSKMKRRVSPDQSTGYAEWYAGIMTGTSQHVAVETLRYLGTLDMTDMLPTIKAPTLILAGEHSETRPQWSEPMHALMPGSHLAIIPHASGFVQHTAPRQCVEVWRDFVKTNVSTSKTSTS
jgi:3-oxoadipate enol-lactonase